MEGRKRKISEVLKRGYADEELDLLYELARFHIENGDNNRAEVLLQGLISVAPDYAPGWLGLCAVHLHLDRIEQAQNAATQVLRVDSESIEAQLFLICCLICLGDFNSAGMYLGEVGDRIKAGKDSVKPEAVRFYRAQLVRYETRK